MFTEIDNFNRVLNWTNLARRQAQISQHTINIYAEERPERHTKNKVRTVRETNMRLKESTEVTKLN